MYVHTWVPMYLTNIYLHTPTGNPRHRDHLAPVEPTPECGARRDEKLACAVLIFSLHVNLRIAFHNHNVQKPGSTQWLGRIASAKWELASSANCPQYVRFPHLLVTSGAVHVPNQCN